MLHAFISARPSAWTGRQIRDYTASVAAHAALVACAVVATTSDGVVERAETVARTAERIVFSAVARPAAAASRSTTPAPRTRLRLERLRVSPTPPVAAPALDDIVFDVPAIPIIDVPGTDAAERVSTSLDLPEGGLADMFAVALGRQARTLPNWRGVYTAEVVEKMVAPYRGNPRPQYPGFLMEAGVEADVDVRFVVDSTGHVDAETLEFPETVHHLFVASVRRALLRSRFLPAEVDGHRVPQLVAQRYSFVMAR
jgi:hypothetical protein